MVAGIFVLHTCAAASVVPLVIAGSPTGVPADSPGQRVDANVPTSPYAGVGSVIALNASGQAFLSSGVLISPRHVLTAGHSVDLVVDGIADARPQDVRFILNANGNASSTIFASAVVTAPNFTGFSRPSGVVNDDLAIITLSSPVPIGTPIYPLMRSSLDAGTTLTMVGYGTTGDGVSGYIASSANPNVKRVGYNVADVFRPDDDGLTSAREVFEFDFDGPTLNGPFGGATLGNNIEATIGPGDSGGGAFVSTSEGLQLAGVLTFGRRYSGSQPAMPLFGSGGGGQIVSAYADWIDSIIPEPTCVSFISILMVRTLLLRRRSIVRTQ